MTTNTVADETTRPKVVVYESDVSMKSAVNHLGSHTQNSEPCR